MFRVCAKFNALFVRPRIQSAIREYQEQLIATVKKDIEILQVNFFVGVCYIMSLRRSKVTKSVATIFVWITISTNIY